MRITLEEIRITYPDLEIQNYNEDIYFENINHDSRINLPNALFVPIVGEKFDGHDFIKNAFNNGCTVSLVQRDHIEELAESKEPLIIVEDILEGLSLIVRLIRSKITSPVIAITGSTGKTTTREMLSTVLSTKGEVLSSDRNFNTLWGNAQILCTYSNQEYVVLEFGMDRKGEIMEQCIAIEPDMGILLNVGYVHAMQLGGIEKVYLAKRELAEYLAKENKPTFFNVDDEWLKRIPELKNSNLRSFSIKNDAFVKGENISVTPNGTSFDLLFDNQKFTVKLSILGEGYVYNALGAFLVSNLLKFTPEEFVNAVEKYQGFKGRFELIEINERVTFINDAYNANPTSMKMSLETFDRIWGNVNDVKKILVLGDMKELGDVTQNKHRELGEFVSEMEVDHVFYIGEYYEDFGYGERVDNVDQLYEKILERISDGKKYVVLFKASNSIGLQDVISRF